MDGSRVAVCLTQASNVWTITFFLMNISVFFVLPLMVLIILYTIIAKKLIVNDMSLAKMRPNKPELSYKARKQVILMLGAVVMAFFTCLLPFRVLTLWIIIAPHEYMEALGVEAYYNLLYFCRIMLYLNSAINPILYNLMSSKFRKGFKKLFYCYCLLSACNRKQHKLKMLKRHHQNSHTMSSHTHTTSLTMTSSRKNSSKMSASVNDEAKILTSVHHVELNCSAAVNLREMRIRQGVDVVVGGTEESHLEIEEDDDDVSDINNVEYELQLRMIDRKTVLLARDFRRPPFTRQSSTPVGVDGNLQTSCCGRGTAYQHHHRHTIHLNDVELGSALMRRNFLAMNKKRRKKQRLLNSTNATAAAEDAEKGAECVTHQLVSVAGGKSAEVEIKRQAVSGVKE